MKSKALILGVGNTIRGDDGVGIIIARTLKDQLDLSGVEIKETERAGMDLLEFMEGHKKAVIIDAIRTKKGRPGTVYRFSKDELLKSKNPFSSHQHGLATLLELGRLANIRLPEEIVIYAIEVKNNNQFT